jgi:NADP-dependent 3-hydroxy acid dehydrogenase YdfG
VHQLLEAGWKVYAGYRKDLGRLAVLEHENLSVHQLDVVSNTSVEEFANNAPQRIDLLINNAGVADGRWRNLN